ncbi:uncharacterized protein JCM15063_001561 [Sporobolomyces koalae]|uniref:uncharacterized protein n=1 Tax=Sporobolomyces koalae TaxID=500713 RepID=UPI00317A2F60
METLSPYHPHVPPLSQQDSLAHALAPPSQPSTSSVSPGADPHALSAALVSGPAAAQGAADCQNPTKKQSCKLFRCNGFGDCQMTFTRSEHLARHVRKHTGERPFKCHCGRTFSRLDNVRQHASTVHAEMAAENAQCIADLVALHSTLSVSTIQKQRDMGMVVQDAEKEAAKARRKAEAAQRPRKISSSSTTRRKVTAAEKKAKEQADAAEAQERRRKESEDSSKPIVQATQPPASQERPSHQSAPRTDVLRRSQSKVVEEPSFQHSPQPAPPPVAAGYPGSYSNHSYASPPQSTSVLYPSYAQSQPQVAYASYGGVYGAPPGTDQMYGYPANPASSTLGPIPNQHQHQHPQSHQHDLRHDHQHQHQHLHPDSSSTSSTQFYSHPHTQSPHVTPGDSPSPRDHHRSSSGQLHHSQSVEQQYPSQGALGYPPTVYPPESNKLSLPSISALLPAPFSRAEAGVAPHNGPELQPQTTHTPVDPQSVYYASMGTTPANRSPHVYPSQVDYMQQPTQQQLVMGQQAMYSQYDTYGRTPSIGAQSERGDVPPSLSNGSSSAASSSFPSDSPSNSQFPEQLAQPPPGSYYHSSYASSSYGHPGSTSYGMPPTSASSLSYGQSPATQYPSMPPPYGVAPGYPAVQSKYGYPALPFNQPPSPMPMHSQPSHPSHSHPPPPHDHAGAHPHPHSQSHVAQPSHEDPRAPATLYPTPQASQSHFAQLVHSRDHSNRSSMASPNPSAGWPLVHPTHSESHPHANHLSQSQNGMFAGPTTLPKRERDEVPEHLHAHHREHDHDRFVQQREHNRLVLQREKKLREMYDDRQIYGDTPHPQQHGLAAVR